MRRPYFLSDLCLDMATYEDVVQKDLELLWSIQDYCYRTPWINSSLARIVSKNPLKDIVIILWGCFAIGLFDIGAKHFWLVTINATVAFGKLVDALLCFVLVIFLPFWIVARKLIEAKRPVEYDIRLQPMTDLNAESYGLA